MITLQKTRKTCRPFFFLVFARCLGKNWTSGPRMMISWEATHCLVSALDGKRIQFGIGILTKRICYYPLLLLNRYFLTNNYYSPISSLCDFVHLCHKVAEVSTVRWFNSINEEKKRITSDAISHR